MEYIEKYWTVISANPLPFIVIAVAVFGITWTIAGQHYSERIETLKTNAELSAKQRDDFKNKLAVSTPDEAKTKVDRLEGELTGLNRIISRTMGYDWDTISPQQVDALADRLAKLPKHRVQVMYLSLLGRDLATQFHQAFQKAGWDGATLSPGGGAHLGIVAGAGSKMAGAVKDAIESTTPYKVILDKPDIAEWGDLIYLFVGANERKG